MCVETFNQDQLVMLSVLKNVVALTHTSENSNAVALTCTSIIQNVSIQCNQQLFNTLRGRLGLLLTRPPDHFPVPTVFKSVVCEVFCCFKRPLQGRMARGSDLKGSHKLPLLAENLLIPACVVSFGPLHTLLSFNLWVVRANYIYITNTWILKFLHTLYIAFR